MHVFHSVFLDGTPWMQLEVSLCAHCYVSQSNTTFDFIPVDEAKSKIKTVCTELYTHHMSFPSTSFHQPFSLFHPSKQYLVKISQFSCQSWLRHFSTVTWCSEGSFGSFECISSLKVVCSRAYVWIWGLFEGRCSSWLHPFNKLPPGNWPLL